MALRRNTPARGALPGAQPELRRRWAWSAAALLAALLAACATNGQRDDSVPSEAPQPAEQAPQPVEQAPQPADLAAQLGVDDDELEGEATWYGRRHHGRTTASGEPFDMHAFTAAHKTLPFGTIVRVTRVDTRQSVVVRINDRGPYGPGRVIDLSRAAAEEIGLIRPGHRPVVIEVLELP